MSAISQHVTVIEIIHHPDNRVTVRMPDEDRMVSTSKAAAIACRAFADQIEFKSQFDSLLQRLGQFVYARQTSIRDAFITPQDSGILFVVVQKALEYDRNLDDELADLEWEIANEEEFRLVQFQSQLLPPASRESLCSFISENALQLKLEK